MSTLRTNNLQSPDSAGVNIVMTEGGGAIFSGIVTAPTLNVTGVLTYDDVTNIDSIGIVTARSGLHVTGGNLTVDAFSNTANNYLSLRNGYVPSSSGGMGFMSADHSGANADGIAIYGHDGISLYTAQTERFRVTSGGNIGIGTDNPSKQITVGAAITTSEFQVSPHAAGWDIASTSGNLAPHYQTEFALYTGQIGSGTQRFKVDSSGRVTMPYQPAFYAYRSGDSNQVSAGDQTFDLTKTNRGNHYSTSNGRFTAPVAGAYFFSAALQLYGGPTTGHMMSFRINGTDFHGSQNSSNPVYDEIAGNHTMLYFSAVITLAANEYVTTWSNQTVRGMQSYFTGYLIG